MRRRDFLHTSLIGLAAIAADPLVKIPSGMLADEAHAATPNGPIKLRMVECLKEMIDLNQVYHWGFDDTIRGPRIPGPVIMATEGEVLDITVYNDLPHPHGFAITGVLAPKIIPSNRSIRFKLRTPAAGIYIYYDPLNDPLNRMMGLHSVLISVPADAAESHCPYSAPTPAVEMLFQDLGSSPMFPGYPWRPQKTAVWIFGQTDSYLHERVQKGSTKTGDDFVKRFLPRYFTINGRSGYFSAHEANDTKLMDHVGNPWLIRNVNVGLWGHSPHVHGNHAYRLAVNGQVQRNVFLLDTWTMHPMDAVDMLYPFVKPPDIPDETWALCEAGTQEEPFPMAYPMHCHQEVSQTANGGNYPQGLITHLVFEGPLGSPGTPGNPPPLYPPRPNHDLPPIDHF
jgi:hypothetical protein